MGTERSGGKEKPGRAVFVASLIVALIGIGFAAYLIHVHQQALEESAGATLCNLGEGVDCEVVALNRWGEIWGVPTAAWGLLVYAGFALIAALGVARRVFPRGPGGLLFWGSIPTVIFGVYLIYIMVTEVDSICVFCLGLDGVHLGLLVTGALAVWPRGAFTALREDVQALWEDRPSMIGILGGPALAAVLIWASFNSAAATVQPQRETDAGVLELPPPMWTDTDQINVASAPSRGPRDAVIVIYEFSDYQCPHCRRAHEDVREVIEQHPDQIRFYHFHHPLGMACNPRVTRPYHPGACVGAAAAICAQRRDKFWELNDLLFEHGRSLDEELVFELIDRVGLDRDQMSRCMRSERTQERILHDLEQALVVPVRGTPTFVVNGRIIPGSIGPTFARMIDMLLENDGRWPAPPAAPEGDGGPER